MILIAAPTRATNPALLDEVAITLQDDVTTQEPILKKCIVDGNTYSHSQTVITITDKMYHNSVIRDRDKFVSEIFYTPDKEITRKLKTIPIKKKKKKNLYRE